MYAAAQEASRAIQVGMIFPIALIFVALQALVVAIAIVGSSRVKRTPLQLYLFFAPLSHCYDRLSLIPRTSINSGNGEWLEGGILFGASAHPAFSYGAHPYRFGFLCRKNEARQPQRSRYIELASRGPTGVARGVYAYALSSPISVFDSDGLEVGVGAIPWPGISTATRSGAGPQNSMKTLCRLFPEGCAVGAAGVGGYIVGSLIYPYIESPLAKLIDSVCMNNDTDKLRKHCQALKDSILNTCYALPPRKRMKCFEAANTAFRQCMGWE
jgi:hypothetical protein